MNKMLQAIGIARKYYNKKTFYHALDVANYVSENYMIDKPTKEDAIIVAILHDLLEDTDLKEEDLLKIFDENIVNAVKILTKDKEQSYVDYCIEIKNSISLFSGQLAYWVKLADMKDHLSKTETLTDKLKAKYLEGLAYLL